MKYLVIYAKGDEFVEEFEDCISDFDINDLLREHNDGMAGYRVEELPIWV